MKHLMMAWLCTLVFACQDNPHEITSPIVSLHKQLGGDAQGYKRACSARTFHFPEDHLAHPEFRNEWWYVTGNVTSDDAKRFGFHATFFRIATRPMELKVSDSNWETNQFYMAHFAVSREGDSHLHASERFARSAAGLAGTALESGLSRVWLEDWELIQTSPGDKPSWQLVLSDGASTAIDLTMSATKPHVLQGENGYSQKSKDPCNASYYYAYTRINTNGTVMLDGQSYTVQGTSWLDREWSSSALAENQVGWDWFALQFDNGREVMFYQLRETDGTASTYSRAVEIDVHGTNRSISVPQLQVKRWWHSTSGGRYPVEGQLTWQDTGKVVRFSPLIDNQELNLTVRYWEGAIVLSDSRGARVGQGYLELTGY